MPLNSHPLKSISKQKAVGWDINVPDTKITHAENKRNTRGAKNCKNKKKKILPPLGATALPSQDLYFIMLKCALRKRTCSPWPQVWRVADLKYGAQSVGSEVKAPNNHFMKWRRWSEARLRAAVTPRLAGRTLKIRPNLGSIHVWPWNPNTELISVELARHNEAGERKDSQAEWGALWMLFLSRSLTRFSLFSLSLAFLVSRQRQGPTGHERHCHKIRHDCIVMLSDNLVHKHCVIHQTSISCPPFFPTMSFMGKKSSRTQMCSLLCRRGAARWRSLDDPGEPYLVGSSRSRSAVSAKFSGTCWI